MLKLLHVKDYALIEAVEIEFEQGLNIITGETGAGKSILIDAMSLLLGERASTEVIRKGAAKAIVEGVFEVEKNKGLKRILEENEIEFHPDLILRREISLKGSNRCFINDTPAPLNLVKDIGNLLVDLHGQHEHQSLLRTETHIDFLDEFGTPPGLLNKFMLEFKKLTELVNYMQDLIDKEDILKEKKDLYAFQIKEIDAVSPEDEEEERLLAELNILENSEKLVELTSSVYHSLYESEKSVHDEIVKIKDLIDELAAIDRSFTETGNECESAITLIKDISDFIRNYSSKIDIDPKRSEELRERLGAINLLKKKYGGSVKAILELRQKIGEEYALAENYSEGIRELENKIKTAREECGKIAADISHSRKASAKKVEKGVEEALKYLGIENPSFKVEMKQSLPEGKAAQYVLIKGEKYNCTSNGVDEVEFYISTNPGEDIKPLAKVASGGGSVKDYARFKKHPCKE